MSIDLIQSQMKQQIAKYNLAIEIDPIRVEQAIKNGQQSPAWSRYTTNQTLAAKKSIELAEVQSALNFPHEIADEKIILEFVATSRPPLRPNGIKYESHCQKWSMETSLSVEKLTQMYKFYVVSHSEQIRTVYEYVM